MVLALLFFGGSQRFDGSKVVKFCTRLIPFRRCGNSIAQRFLSFYGGYNLFNVKHCQDLNNWFTEKLYFKVVLFVFSKHIKFQLKSF